MEEITQKLKNSLKSRKIKPLVYKQSKQHAGTLFITDLSAK